MPNFQSFSGTAGKGRRESHPYNVQLENLSVPFPFPFQISSKHLPAATNVTAFPKGLISMSAGLLVRQIHHHRS